MSIFIAAPANPQDVAENSEHVIEAVGHRHPPVVITEQEVAFSTAAAAAVPLLRPKPARRVIAAFHAMFPSSSGDAWSAPHRHLPRFIEEATMAREMRRL